MISDMDNEKAKLIKKVKLIYSIELAIFSILFAVLGPLFLTEVISVADWKRVAFTYITLVGGLWLITDFIWMLVSPKRRKKNSFFDKIIVLPAALASLTFDIYVLSAGLVHIGEGEATSPVFHYYIGSVMIYLSACYIAQIIYHWFRPLPSLMLAVEEALAEEAEEKEKEAAENAAKELSIEEVSKTDGEKVDKE